MQRHSSSGVVEAAVRTVGIVTFVAIATIATIAGAPAFAQLDDTATFLADLSNAYRVVPNVTYHVASGHENKLDLYLPNVSTGPTPVLLYIHGGGWVGGSKEGNVLRTLPYLKRGWAVVSVEYRLGRVARAPAAVEDCLCALRWVAQNAQQYNLDTSRIVTSGHSAGGHLSLTTAMIPASAGLNRECPGASPSVAAIVNWYGITDVGDLIDGPNMKTYAVRWLGSFEDRFTIAKRVSPLTYVRQGLPPVLTIHGDADSIVPYQHALKLHERLAAAGVTNQLHTVPGGDHGRFNTAQTIAIFETIDRFLASHDLKPSPVPPR